MAEIFVSPTGSTFYCSRQTIGIFPENHSMINPENQKISVTYTFGANSVKYHKVHR